MRNRALEALVWITGILIIAGIIVALLFSMIVGIVLLALGLLMGVITLVTKAIASGQRS